MIKHSIILCMALFAYLSGFSQTTNDSIETSPITTETQVKDTIQYQKAGMGYKYTLNNEPLTLDKMSNIMQDNPTSVELIKKAKSTTGLITILGYVGGFLIGYPLGTAMRGGEANWSLAAIGCGFIAVAIPIASAADKNLLKAVQTYNMDAPTTSIENYELKFGTTQNGLGFTFRF
jgi:hypothetical protein